MAPSIVRHAGRPPSVGRQSIPQKRFSTILGRNLSREERAQVMFFMYEWVIRAGASVFFHPLVELPTFLCTDGANIFSNPNLLPLF